MRRKKGLIVEGQLYSKYLEMSLSEGLDYSILYIRGDEKEHHVHGSFWSRRTPLHCARSDGGDRRGGEQMSSRGKGVGKA